MADDSEFRQMTPYERAVLDRLLSVEFDGVEAAREQARSARVRPIDDDGCFEFLAVDGPDIQCDFNVLSEGSGPSDADGIPVLLMLFQSRGRLASVDFVRFEGDPGFFPNPDEWIIHPYMGEPTVGTEVRS